MKEEIKIYWALYEEYFSNEEILKNFGNLMELYHPKKNGSILDIGCGQSPYLIDFYINSNHNLFACDTEINQIKSLKRRLKNIDSKSIIKYSTNEFPNKEFEGVNFSGVIVSNLLHFLTLNESAQLVENIENQIERNSILLFRVHSWKHSSNGNFSYFKHYFKKADFYKLIPKSKYEYLYFDEISASKTPKQIEFTNEWIKRLANQKNVFAPQEIEKMQISYLAKSNTHNMTLVVRKK